MSRFFEHILKKGKNFGNFYFDWACEYIGWQMNRKGCVVQFCIFAMITIRLRDQDTFSALLRNTNSCKQKMPHQGPSINKWQAPFPWNFRQWYCLQTWKFCKQTAETVISSVLPIRITLMKLSNTIFLSYLYKVYILPIQFPFLLLAALFLLAVSVESISSPKISFIVRNRWRNEVTVSVSTEVSGTVRMEYIWWE